ncbi:unnamed protein product [Linum trigynum]
MASEVHSILVILNDLPWGKPVMESLKRLEEGATTERELAPKPVVAGLDAREVEPEPKGEANRGGDGDQLPSEKRMILLPVKRRVATGRCDKRWSDSRICWTVNGRTDRRLIVWGWVFESGW